MTTTGQTDTDLVAAMEADGYVVVPGLLAREEVQQLGEEFMALQARGPIPHHFEPVSTDPAAVSDILQAYPRVMHPHQVNELALRYLLDPRFGRIVEQLLGEEPLAAQSMFYFKPPGARGQALHQDNFYLRVEPGTCMAAWVAVDRCDRENGGLEVVPGTHRMEVFCPEEADTSVSFTTHYVPPPPGLHPVPVDMEPGDVLFFNGSLVHGSGPNHTTDRFRRAFICHYVGRSVAAMSNWYPTITMAGERVHLAPATGGGPCGTEATAAH